VYVVALGSVLMDVGLRQMRVTWIIPLVWFFLTCTRIRHCSLFAITAAIALADVLSQTPFAAWLAREQTGGFTDFREQKEGRPAVGVLAFLLPTLAVLAAFGAQTAGWPLPLLGKDRVEQLKLWPTALLPQLLKYQDDHPDASIFNDMAYGGFL